MMKKRLRSHDEIRDESLDHRITGWTAYQENLRQGKDEAEAIRLALLKALPRGAQGSTNRSRELGLWQDHKLWPPPELQEADRCITSQPPSDTVVTPEGVAEAEGDKTVESQVPTPPVTTVRQRETPEALELSDDEIIRRAKEILMKDVFVAERPTTAKGRESTLKTSMIAARFPNDLVTELKALGGRVSHHLEKALRLYLKVLKSE